LKANGALVSRVTYATLFTAIGTTFGVGDGSTTFALPDLRGEFVRGYDDGRGIDAARVFGSAQADAFESHNHGMIASGFPDTFDPAQHAAGRTITGNWGASSWLEGGTETRPRNIALLMCIKF
jgi:microcystin-dependent protein